MKKKSVNIILVIAIVSAVLCALSVGGYFLVTHLQAGEGMDEALANKEIAASLLRCQTAEELEGTAADLSFELLPSEDKTLYITGEMPLERSTLNLYFQQPAEAESLLRVDGQLSLDMGRHSAANMQKAWQTVIGEVLTFLNVDLPVESVTYSVFDADGFTMDVDAEDTQKSLLAGEARYNLTAIDWDGTYWSIHATVAEGGILQVEFFHYFESGVYEVGNEHIVLH